MNKAADPKASNLEAERLRSELAQFTGRDQRYYSFPIDTGVVFTEGVRHLAWRAGALWLLADIAFAQDQSARVRQTGFQVWTFVVQPNKKATLRCEDGNGNTVYTRDYGATDFPLPEIELFLVSNVIYLPSEH